MTTLTLPTVESILLLGSQHWRCPLLSQSSSSDHNTDAARCWVNPPRITTLTLPAVESILLLGSQHWRCPLWSQSSSSDHNTDTARCWVNPPPRITTLKLPAVRLSSNCPIWMDIICHPCPSCGKNQLHVAAASCLLATDRRDRQTNGRTDEHSTVT